MIVYISTVIAGTGIVAAGPGNVEDCDWPRSLFMPDIQTFFSLQFIVFYTDYGLYFSSFLYPCLYYASGLKSCLQILVLSMFPILWKANWGQLLIAHQEVENLLTCKVSEIRFNAWNLFYGFCGWSVSFFGPLCFYNLKNNLSTPQ